ncbi:MAG: hypothetical protein LBL55_08715 [Propionibacteriaceae bacterium]|nr:hypothetical protein [Propionibacteriaceae bacterium]
MTDSRMAEAPVVVEEKSHRRRAAGIIASAALGTALLAGLTLAAFTDQEFAGLNHDGASKPGYGVAGYNIQISEQGKNTWHDTTMLDGSAPDNLAKDTEEPLVLVISNADKIIPGDAASWPSVSFDVRNDETSTVNSSLHFRLIDAGAAGATSPTLLSALKFDVTVSGAGAASWTNKTFGDLDDPGATLVAASAKPGEVYTITITVKLPEQSSATANSALQGLQAHLIAAVDGASVLA